VNINSAKPVTLKDVIAANPGISMPEAVVRLNAYNSAIARGEVPPPLSASAQILRTLIAPPIMTMNNPLQNPLLPANILTSLQTQNPQDIASKPHREVYVGNLPPGITVPQLAEFLNTALRQIGAIPPPGESSSYTAVITAWISPDGHYGFVELRTMEQANIALQQLNGIQVGIHQLKLGRPKGYNPNSNITSVAVPMSSTSLPLGAPLGASVAAGVGGIGAANPLLAGLGLLQGGANPDLQQSRVVMVANLPVLITEAQIVDLFGSFGSFKAFNLIPVPLSSGSAGATQSAVFEYDSTVSLDIIDSVISGMNGLDLGGNKITVSRVPLSSAAILLKPKAASTETATFNSVPAQAVDNSTQKPVHAAFLEEEQLKSHLLSPTRVLRLSNMTNPEEDFADEQLYQELIEDVESECNKYGAVQRVVIPRELTPAHPAYGVIFVSFAQASGAQAARDKIQGRKFNGQVVQAMYFPEVLFAENTFALPIDYRFDNATVNENEQHHLSLRETKNFETSSLRPVTAADELD
jgi:splicing factor U2AF subunit